jgi:hypothetical protein
VGINGGEEKTIMPEPVRRRTAYMRFWVLTAVKIYDFNIPGHRTSKVMTIQIPTFRINLLSSFSALNKR